MKIGPSKSRDGAARSIGEQNDLAAVLVGFPPYRGQSGDVLIAAAKSAAVTAISSSRECDRTHRMTSSARMKSATSSAVVATVGL